MCHAKISDGRKTGAIIECGGSLQKAFDWVQRSSVAADNNRIYAEGLVTSRQARSSVASFNSVENFYSEGLGSEVVTMVQTAEPRHVDNSGNNILG